VVESRIFPPPCEYSSMPTKPTKPTVKSKSIKMPGSTKKRLGLPTHKDILDAYGIDAICTRIAGGESQRSIAKSLGVHDGSFIEWLAAIPERSERARESRRIAAVIWDERAEEVLLGMTESPMGIARANALASHFRWRAKAHNPRDFSGER